MVQQLRKERNHKVKSIVREYIEAFAIAFILAMIIKAFVVEAFKIPTGSMEPTLHGAEKGGDRILVNKFIYRFKEIERGDIVVFKTKGIKGLDLNKDYIKRVIGLPEETLEIKDGDIYINGEKITDPRIDNIEYINTDETWGPYGYPEKKVKIPPNHYYVLGDNSANSKDSRVWGFVPKKILKGELSSSIGGSSV